MIENLAGVIKANIPKDIKTTQVGNYDYYWEYVMKEYSVEEERITVEKILLDIYNRMIVILHEIRRTIYKYGTISVLDKKYDKNIEIIKKYYREIENISGGLRNILDEFAHKTRNNNFYKEGLKFM